MSAAVEADGVVLIDRGPGDSLVAGTPLGFIWPRGSVAPFDPPTRDRLSQRAVAAVHAGHERTAAQDVAFGLRQLVDVAVKALSPGINDPTTAVHALGHVSALLCEALDHRLGPVFLTDDEGYLRVVLRRPDLAALLDLAVSAPRRYGSTDPDVLRRLFDLLREVAWCAERPEDCWAVVQQTRRLRATAAEQRFDEDEQRDLAQAAERVDQALAERWPSP